MEIEIYWTKFSEKELEKVFDYYLEQANFKIAKKITDGIYNAVLKLKEQPEIGQIEELLEQRKQEFRYLVYKDYKVIYWINRDQNWIEIYDVFDTR